MRIVIWLLNGTRLNVELAMVAFGSHEDGTYFFEYLKPVNEYHFLDHTIEAIEEAIIYARPGAMILYPERRSMP